MPGCRELSLDLCNVMPKSLQVHLSRLLESVVAPTTLEASLRALHLPRTLDVTEEGISSRAVISMALNVALFGDLLERVPTGRAYVNDCVARGREVVFDHGALRTVALEGMGNLPAGEEAITRVLLPLGYRMNAVYPLDRLGMTGRAYTHADHPECLPQFFVSELHPERFSAEFLAAVRRVTATSVDCLTDSDHQSLRRLQQQRSLDTNTASRLLRSLLGCFRRQHGAPAWSDYQILLAESAEMAWIATEGNAFNHATDRVASIDALVEEQSRTGRPLKPTIESSKSGRVRQTAFRADRVTREFLRDDGSRVEHQVPGSFYEFIQRDFVSDPATGGRRLDLAFDSNNAQGIFKMTAAGAHAVPLPAT
ncbi:MAG: hypothetical protein QOI59_3049 [Gammaproteobacteria bacterium]|nr:hypothetical protein [Gammaproteobacteria bacterium]